MKYTFAGAGVVIGPQGQFVGRAWGENIGSPRARLSCYLRRPMRWLVAQGEATFVARPDVDGAVS